MASYEAVLAVAFGTSDWGVAIVEGGALAETRDGGRSWTRRSAPVARGLALRAVLGGVVVTDANGSEHLIQGGRDTPKVGPSRAPREAEPAMRRALVEHRDGAALRVAVTPEGPCRSTFHTLYATAFERFFVVDPSPRADVRGAAMRVTGRRVVALAAPQDASRLRFPGAVGRVWSAGQGSLQLRWRLLGDLVTRSASIAPGSFGPSGIDVLAATRAGLFVRGTGSSLTPVWTGAVDTRVTLPSPTLLAATGYTSTTTRAVPTEDGGFVLYAMPPELEPPNTAYARPHDEPQELSRNRLVRCGSGGCDAFDWYGQSDRAIVRAIVRAIGRRGADWGLVVQGAAGLSFVTAAGAERLDVDLGASPALCGASRGTMELHVSARDEFGACFAEIGPGLDAPDFARCTRVVYELQGRGLCVRRVEGEREDHPDGPYAEGGPEVPGAGVWFDARGASLVGGVDDGHTIQSMRAVLRVYNSSPMEFE